MNPDSNVVNNLIIVDQPHMAKDRSAPESFRHEFEQFNKYQPPCTPKVLVAYVQEQQSADLHQPTLRELTQFLFDNGVAISKDENEQLNRQLGMAFWLDNQIKNNDFIVVCISPSYASAIEKHESADDKLCEAKYIYTQLHVEYTKNGSKNYRFVPLLISGGEK